MHETVRLGHLGLLFIRQNALRCNGYHGFAQIDSKAGRGRRQMRCQQAGCKAARAANR